MSSKNKKKLKKSLLINPNLGRPRFLKVLKTSQNKVYKTSLLFVSSYETAQKFSDQITDNINLTPVLEYKWMMSRVLEKEKDEMKKKRRIISRIKQFFRRKEDYEETYNEKIKNIEKLKPRAYNGDLINTIIIDVVKTHPYAIDDLSYLDDEYCNPQQFLVRDQVFKGLDYFYCVEIKFNLSKEVIDFLKKRQYVMFNIKSLNNRVNHHSLVLTKQKWKDFTFFQISDLHLAERNDQIYQVISDWIESPVKQNVDTFFDKIVKTIKSPFQKDEEKSEKPPKILKKPLNKRLINPNNQLRSLIRKANTKIMEDKLDFIVITGDIVDFAIKSKSTKNGIDLANYDIRKSNWDLFKQIILNSNKNSKKPKGVQKGEELLCPIFTILGNHDYRPYHYDLTWGGLYKKIGLQASEASALNELFSASPISAITKSHFAISNYISDINSYKDFTLKLGKTLFIFLDSGPDSFKNIRDFLSGHPSLTGLKDFQIKYLQNIVNSKQKEIDNIILLLHGPPINIGGKQYFMKRLERMGKPNIRNKLEDFKESVLAKLGKPHSYARIDESYNVKFGTISSNWEEIIKFCKDHTILTLSGHTHLLKEFRLADTEEKTKLFDAPPFILKRLENPAAVYYDVYSELNNTAKSIKKKTPFIVQTPALGLGNYYNPKVVGGYRIIKFRNGNLDSFKVKFLREDKN
ncbi:MAG: hypothetical protein GF317_11600 [Candidatus Lokiarchaeota archaeon]|nr:hypothetical protein [Candidatus Lokiarchaeota archaeon]MBD3200295.1 hypothetical protein [Candidatus Lokiarchaeota archaeon]